MESLHATPTNLELVVGYNRTQKRRGGIEDIFWIVLAYKSLDKGESLVTNYKSGVEHHNSLIDFRYGY